MVTRVASIVADAHFIKKALAQNHPNADALNNFSERRDRLRAICGLESQALRARRF